MTVAPSSYCRVPLLLLVGCRLSNSPEISDWGQALLLQQPGVAWHPDSR